MDQIGKQSEKLLPPPAGAAINDLAYAPVVRRPRRWIIRLTVGLLAFAGLLAGTRRLRDEYPFAQRWYWQRQCLAYVNPTGAIPISARCPDVWRHFRYPDEKLPPELKPLFLGSIENADGRPRFLTIIADLIVVNGRPRGCVNLVESWTVDFHAACLDRKTNNRVGGELDFAIYNPTFGQRDPAAKNHVTFVADTIDRKGVTFDVWLAANDRVLLERR